MSTQHIGYLMKDITDKIKVRADADLKNHNLTLTQSRVLTFLGSKQGQATQKEIEDFLEVSHPTIVGVVGRMEQKGFLVTWFDAADKRNKIVTLTDQAKKIVSDMNVMIDEQEQNMLKGLSSQQISELASILQRMYKNLS